MNKMDNKIARAKTLILPQSKYLEILAELPQLSTK